jgi:hypothetical protein
MRDRLRDDWQHLENDVLSSFSLAAGAHENVDPRWMSIARTHIQQGFMAAKRALYEGKRVGDE